MNIVKIVQRPLETWLYCSTCTQLLSTGLERHHWSIGKWCNLLVSYVLNTTLHHSQKYAQWYETFEPRKECSCEILNEPHTLKWSALQFLQRPQFCTDNIEFFTVSGSIENRNERFAVEWDCASVQCGPLEKHNLSENFFASKVSAKCFRWVYTGFAQL